MKQTRSQPEQAKGPKTPKARARTRKALPEAQETDDLRVQKGYDRIVHALVHGDDRLRRELVTGVSAVPFLDFALPVLDGLFRALASPDEASRAGAHAALLAFSPLGSMVLVKTMLQSRDAVFRARAVDLLAEQAPTLPASLQLLVAGALVDRSVYDDDPAIRTAADLAIQALDGAPDSHDASSAQVPK